MRGRGAWGLRGHWAGDAGVISDILFPEYQGAQNGACSDTSESSLFL